MTNSTCSICNRIYLYEKSKGHTKNKCNSCLINVRRFSLKEKCLAYKGGKCELCGYSKSKRALTFHHMNSTEKEFGIAGSHCRKWEDIKAELDKCQLLCMNCHMEEHEKLDSKQFNLAAANKKFLNKCNGCNLQKKIQTNGLCKKCSSAPSKPRWADKIVWPSKEELEKMVWTTPSSKLALQLGIGDKAIQKRCKKYGITKPGPGYWRKLETGKL